MKIFRKNIQKCQQFFWKKCCGNKSCTTLFPKNLLKILNIFSENLQINLRNFQNGFIWKFWKKRKFRWAEKVRKNVRFFFFFSVSKYHLGLVEKRYGRTFYGKMKPSEHNLWKITDFDKKSHTLRGWEKILRFFFEKKYFLTRVPSISFPKNLILKDSIEAARRNLQLKGLGKTCTPPCNQLAK